MASGKSAAGSGPNDPWQQATQYMQTFQQNLMGASPFGMPGIEQLFSQASGPAVRLDPARLIEIQKTYLQDAMALWNQGATARPQGDRRFAGEAWASNPVAGFTAAVYLLNARTLMAMADAVDGDDKTRTRVRFAVQQWIDASAPSNFLAFNAEAQKKAIETQGESIAKGVANLLHDMKQGHVSMTDESVFEVGKNVATTEGAVVFENELFQLIEYKPLTAKVYERPFLLVPPCINKFYILDLQPENSFIRYCVEQGHRTFVVSWRNPDESLAKKTWDNYIEDAVIRAINVTQDITGAEQINALGFCVGGTMLGTALAVLAGRGEEPVHSATFLTTLLDFRDTGILDLFIDEPFVQFREMQFADGGLMPGRDLATTFSFLRPNDLVWNYVVGNYLKGETPPPFDLLYWNSDSTNLPGPFYAWYLRNTYFENTLVKRGKLTVCGEKMDENQKNFIHTLASNKRLALLPFVKDLFAKMKAQQEKTIDVEVTAAFELPVDLINKLAQALSAKLDRKVSVQGSVDKSLLGGVVIHTGDMVIDGSVRGRLAKLAEAMKS